jgi:oligosaccharide repeat unit polymerase
LPSSFLFLENIDVSHRRNEIFKILSSSAVWSIVLAVIFFVVVGSLRNGAEISSGFYQISQYLQFPLINLEWQIAEFGFFWGQSNWFPLISGMIPHKLLASSDISQSMAQLVFGFTYPEPGIGAGYFGPAHLALGLTGVIVYGFFTGLVSAFFYSKSQISVVWIVPYSFFIWPLISAHSYNHFLTLLFFPAPLLISLALSKITIKTVKS